LHSQSAFYFKLQVLYYDDASIADQIHS
jgi:hypothetical protein